MALLKKQEKLCEELGDQAGLSISYWNMGLLYRQMNDHETAIKNIEKTIELKKFLNHPDLEKNLAYLEKYKQSIDE